MMKTQVSIAFVSLFAFGTPFFTAGDMVGVRKDGVLYSVDSGTGSGEKIGSSGIASSSALAVDHEGQAYIAAFDGSLYRIDKKTGAPKYVANLGVGVRAMAFDASNRLYSLVASTAGDDVDGYLKYEYEGVQKLVGSTGLPGLHSLAFDKHGNLYGWDSGTSSTTGTGLNLIDTETGKATDVEASVSGWTPAGPIEYLAFGPDGVLYGGSSSLYSISVETGKVKLIGSGSYGTLVGADFSASDPSCVATWSVSGEGYPGKLGIPKIGIEGFFPIEYVCVLVTTSSSVSAEIAYLLIGNSTTSVKGPWGGNLLVNPAVVLPLVMPPSGAKVHLPLPSDSNLCGIKVYFQMIQTDPAAAHGASSTQRLSLTIGG